MPCAPAAMLHSAARITLGIPMLRVFRSSATLFRLTLSRVMSSGRSCKLETDDTSDDEGHTDHPCGVRRFPKKHDTEDYGADCANADPDAVGRANGKGLHRYSQKRKA